MRDPVLFGERITSYSPLHPTTLLCWHPGRPPGRLEAVPICRIERDSPLGFSRQRPPLLRLRKKAVLIEKGAKRGDPPLQPQDLTLLT